MSRSPRVLPFKVIPQDLVEPDPAGWEVQADGFKRLLKGGNGFREWDAALRFRIQRTYKITRDFRSILGLSCDAGAFEMAAFVTTAHGQRRTIVSRVALPNTISGAVQITFEPDSREVAHDIEIEVGIHLAANIASSDPLAPTHKASRLWSHSERIRLEGGSARLAMYESDIGKMRPGQGLERARLLVEIRGEAEQPFEQAVVVWLNTRRRDFTDALNACEMSASEDAWTAIVRQLCVMALQSDWWDAEETYAAGSLGETVGRWLQQLGNGIWSVSDLRSKTTNDPAAFDGMVNSFVAGLNIHRSGRSGV